MKKIIVRLCLGLAILFSVAVPVGWIIAMGFVAFGDAESRTNALSFTPLIVAFLIMSGVGWLFERIFLGRGAAQELGFWRRLYTRAVMGFALFALFAIPIVLVTELLKVPSKLPSEQLAGTAGIIAIHVIYYFLGLATERWVLGSEQRARLLPSQASATV